jgi:hypothetical protein
MNLEETVQPRDLEDFEDLRIDVARRSSPSFEPTRLFTVINAPNAAEERCATSAKEMRIFGASMASMSCPSASPICWMFASSRMFCSMKPTRVIPFISLT